MQVPEKLKLPNVLAGNQLQRCSKVYPLFLFCKYIMHGHSVIYFISLWTLLCFLEQPRVAGCSGAGEETQV